MEEAFFARLYILASFERKKKKTHTHAHRCVALFLVFLVFLSCPIGLYFCFCASTILS